MVWILLLLMTGDSKGGLAAHSITFQTKEACLKALKFYKEDGIEYIADPQISRVSAICVEDHVATPPSAGSCEAPK